MSALFFLCLDAAHHERRIACALAASTKGSAKPHRAAVAFPGGGPPTRLDAAVWIQSAAASRDLALYKELAPDNIDYESRGKRYLLGADFAPLFPTPSSQVLSWLAEQLGDATAPSSDALLPCLMPSRLSSPELDVLACITRGCFPCQDVSAAGKRAGIKDGTRSGLWAIFADAIDRLRPTYVVIENVRGLLSAQAHRDMESTDPTV